MPCKYENAAVHHVHYSSFLTFFARCFARLALCSDPESKGPFAKSLYGDDTFMRALYNSLSDDGVLVMQLGEAPKSFSPDETYSKFKNRAALMSFLEKVGFQSIHTYEEVSYCSFLLLFEGSGALMSHFALLIM